MSGDDQRRSALAAALGAALASGELMTVLEAVRKAHRSDPGYDDGKRVVEAVELLMSQVWLEPSHGADPFAAAGGLLNACRLEEALAAYEAELARDPASERAAQLSDRTRLVIAAMAGAALPEPEALPSVEIDISLIDASGGELPNSAFGFDDVTAPVNAQIPAEAYREEPTMELHLGEYELSGSAVRASEETTRVAGPGELPLEQLRAEMRAEEEAERRSSDDLDGLLDELEDEPDAQATEVSSVEPIPVRGEPIMPRRISSPHIPSVAQLKADPKSASLEPEVGAVDQSWTGLPIDDHDTSFEPDLASITADQWDDVIAAISPGSKEEAEAMIASGDLGEALRLYQELAAKTPDDQRLWDRVAEVAKMLQRQSNPEE